MWSVLEKVRAAVERHRMIPAGTRVAVAVSGGIDSVVLLDVLREIAPKLAVLHLNHRLRGAESDEDERFVSRLAADCELPFRSEAIDLPAGNCEQEARLARLDFFRRVIADGFADRVATGHTLSDQAETVLYRLLRGAGTAGLSGIRAVTDDGRIRPLLDCSRAEIESWAGERALQWREDRTNDDVAFARNRIRHSLLPLLTRDFSPAVPEILAATARMALDEEDYWTRQTADLFAAVAQRKGSAVLLNVEALRSLHPALARRIVRRGVASVKGNLRGLDLRHVDAVLQLAASEGGHGRLQAPGLDVFRSFEWLRIAPPRVVSRFALDYTIPVTGPATIRPEGSETAIFLEIRDVLERGNYTMRGDELDWERLAPPVELRNWHPGDEFQPPERTRRKLKTLFQEARVPIWDRHLWPVLTSAGRIVWTRGFGTADGFLPGGRTRTVLRVYEIEDDAPGGLPVTGRSGESDGAA
jgi:tRNA(Ile)-lysidine synthase